MKVSEAVGCGAGLLGALVVLPLWLYLVYQILVLVNASPAMWACYWVYLAANVALSITAGVTKLLTTQGD